MVARAKGNNTATEEMNWKMQVACQNLKYKQVLRNCYKREKNPFVKRYFFLST